MSQLDAKDQEYLASLAHTNVIVCMDYRNVSSLIYSVLYDFQERVVII